jgi:hypothetical protein
VSIGRPASSASAITAGLCASTLLGEERQRRRATEHEAVDAMGQTSVLGKDDVQVAGQPGAPAALCRR